MIRLRSTHSTANDEDEEESTTTSISLINQSKYCLYLLNDNETTSTTTSSGKIDFLDDIQLHVCLGVGDAGEEQTGDIEKQLQKGLVRVIGETNLIKSKAFKKKMCSSCDTTKKTHRRHVNFTSTAHHHADSAVVSRSISHDSWQMSHLSHRIADSSLHVSDSRSDGHAHSEDSLVVRDLWIYDVYKHPLLHLLAQCNEKLFYINKNASLINQFPSYAGDVFRHLEDIQKDKKSPALQWTEIFLLLPISRFRRADNCDALPSGDRRDELVSGRLATADRKIRMFSEECETH